MSATVSRGVREVLIPAAGVQLSGDLCAPAGADATVVFVHGSGSSRLSPRNQQVAASLNDRGFATLLFDLLTVPEEQDRVNVFDIELLASRLVEVTGWLRAQPGVGGLPIGYFGASTGGGAALVAAAQTDVGAVVSRGGRPDLAGRFLAQVKAPTLLIVGGRDQAVLDLNRQAQSQLRCPNRLMIVPGATHLFAEPGAMGTVCELAGDWFESHL